MAQTVLIEQAESVAQRTRETSLENLAEPADHPVSRAAQAAGLASAVGTIAFAGQYVSGEYTVQFNRSDGHGFSSIWPAWAYEIARSALVSNKRIWVGSNGDPFGANLVFVFLYAF